LLFVRGEARAESNRCVEHRLEAPLPFIRGATCVKSIDFLLSKGPPIESPLLFVYGATHIKRLSFLLNKRPPIGSPLLFVCGATHVKRLNFC
jgi:hypothetical protein